MSVSQKDYDALAGKYKLLEQQLSSQQNENTHNPTPTTSVVAKPKLRSFRGSKFSGGEDFEGFRLHYNAEKALGADNFVGLTQGQSIAHLTSAVEGKALDVIRSSIALHSPNTTHAAVWKDLETAYKDSAEGDRALQKIQTLSQRDDLEAYIREFNML